MSKIDPGERDELATLVEAAREGSRDAFDELVRRTYVDTYTPTIGHDTCKLPVLRYIEPVVPVQDAAPVHPNRRGEAALARAVVAAIG